MEELRTRPERSGPSPTDAALVRLAWMIAIALVLALAAPGPLFAATLSATLGIGALATTVAAAVVREPVWPAHLTRWDCSALLYVLASAFGWLVDRQEVRLFLAEQGMAG